MDILKITYTNYKGHTAERRITPSLVWFGATEWHPEPQWLLRAYDHDRQADRDFALASFGHPAPAEALRKAASPLASRADSHDAPSFGEGPDDDRALVQVPLGELRDLRVALAALRTSAPAGQQVEEGGDV